MNGEPNEIVICAWRVSRQFPLPHQLPRAWRGGPVTLGYFEAASLAEIRRAVRHMLTSRFGWSKELALRIPIRVRFSLPETLRRALATRTAALEELERARQAADAATLAALHEIVAVEDVSFRDAAEILGLSRARLHQLFRAHRLGRIRAFLRSRRREMLRFLFLAERELRLTPSCGRESPADASAGTPRTSP